MSKTWFLVRALAGLIVIGLLIVGGWAIYRTGWSQGYLAAGSEAGAIAPYAPYGFGYPGGPFGARLFFTVGLFILLLVVIGKCFRFWAWRTAGGPWMMAGGPMDRHWARHWHRPHGPVPPWCWGWEKPSDERAEEAGSGAEASDAEGES